MTFGCGPIASRVCMDVSGATRVLALIGDPVAQERSPLYMNAHLAARGNDAVLVPFQVAPDQLPSLIAGLRGVGNFAGAIVTMPHKKALVPLVERLAPSAVEVGAANVMRREHDGSLTGAMLEGIAFLAGLESIGQSVSGKRVLLIGAGGAAHAIAFALVHAGIRSIALINRTPARAAELAVRLRELGAEVEVVEHLQGRRYDLVVNA